MNGTIVRLVRSAGVLIIASVALVATPRNVQAQVFGYGYGIPYGGVYGGGPGFGYPYGAMGAGAPLGYGYPAGGVANPAFGYGYGYPAFGYGYGYGITGGGFMPAFTTPVLNPNPLFGLGLSPLGVQSALTEMQVLGRGYP